MRSNRKASMLALMAVILLALAGCGGGGGGSVILLFSSSTPPRPPVTAATGRILRAIPMACGARCPQPCRSTRSTRHFFIPERFFWSLVLAIVLRSRPDVRRDRSIPQGAALLDLSSKTITTMPTSWDMFCNGMSIMQDGRVLINGGTKGYGALAVVGVQGEIPFTGSAQTLRSSIPPASRSSTWLRRLMVAGIQP